MEIPAIKFVCDWHNTCPINHIRIHGSNKDAATKYPEALLYSTVILVYIFHGKVARVANSLVRHCTIALYADM